MRFVAELHDEAMGMAVAIRIRKVAAYLDIQQTRDDGLKLYHPLEELLDFLDRGLWLGF